MRTVRPLLLLLPLGWNTGCQTSTEHNERLPPDGAILALDARIAAAQAELVRTERAIEEKRREAAFFECKTEVEGVRARMSEERASCAAEVAEHAECRATVERGKGDASLFGCLLGFAVAAYSGGSAAPIALSGCAMGRVAGEVMAAECPEPSCVEEAGEVLLAQLRARGWETLPACGGTLRVAVETPLLGIVGALEVLRPGRLAVAGLSHGDAITHVGEERVKSTSALRLGLETHADGDVELGFVRDHVLYRGRAPVPARIDSLRYQVEPVARVEHRWSARIARRDEDSALPEDSVGRDITHVNGLEVASAEHLADILRYEREGTSVEVRLRTPVTLESTTLRVELLPREGRFQL